MNLIFNSDIVNLLLNTFFFFFFFLFLFCSLECFNYEWVVVVWNSTSCLGPNEIRSFVFLVLFKDGRCRVSPRFNLFVSDVNQRMKDVAWVQDFLARPLLTSSASC